MSNDDAAEKLRAWDEGLRNYVRREHFNVLTDDEDGNPSFGDSARKAVKRAIEDLLREDDSLRSLSNEEAARKLLGDPRGYHPKIAHKAFGRTFVSVIREDQRKKNLY